MKLHDSTVAALVVSLTSIIAVGAATQVEPPLAAKPATAPATAPVQVELPADQDHAVAALRASPRHGEWVEIPLPAVEGDPRDAAPATLRTWVVYPERKDKAPVVIVIHEIFGLTDWIRAVTDRLAGEGFIAIAPDLLSGKGPGGGGTDSFQQDAVREAIRKLSPEELMQRLNAARAYALDLPAAGSTTATIGFCWGGSTSFAYAGKQPSLNAAVVCYGSAPYKGKEPDSAAMAAIACPVLGLYGGDDARVTSTVDATTNAMKSAGKEYSPHVFDGAGHGFMRDQAGRNGANASAAQLAWSRAIEFLKKHLER